MDQSNSFSCGYWPCLSINQNSYPEAIVPAYLLVIFLSSATATLFVSTWLQFISWDCCPYYMDQSNSSSCGYCPAYQLINFYPEADVLAHLSLKIFFLQLLPCIWINYNSSSEFAVLAYRSVKSYSSGSWPWISINDNSWSCIGWPCISTNYNSYPKIAISAHWVIK